MRRPQYLVKPLIPVNSNASSSTSPNAAQKSDWDVSNKLSTVFHNQILLLLEAYIAIDTMI